MVDSDFRFSNPDQQSHSVTVSDPEERKLETRSKKKRKCQSKKKKLAIQLAVDPSIGSLEARL